MLSWLLLSSLLFPSAHAALNVTEVLAQKAILNEAFVSFRMAILESECGPIAHRKGKPDYLLPSNYQTYCWKELPVAMFVKLEDGRTASIEVCNLETKSPKVYCPTPPDKFNFDEAVRFSK